MRTIRPLNDAEAEFFDRMKAAGWTCTKRGWPDFFCFNGQGEVCCGEVKPKGICRLKKEQAVVMKFLQSKGIKCYKWTPDDGFTDPLL